MQKQPVRVKPAEFACGMQFRVLPQQTTSCNHWGITDKWHCANKEKE